MKERNICFSLARSGWIGIFFPDRRENPSSACQQMTNPSGRNRDRRVISSPGTGFLSTQCLMKTLVPGSQLVTTFLCEEMLSAVRWKDAADERPSTREQIVTRRQFESREKREYAGGYNLLPSVSRRITVPWRQRKKIQRKGKAPR